MAQVTRSGRMPKRCDPNQVPSRPNPQITSSAISSTSYVGAQLLHPLPVAGHGMEDAAGADHRLADEGGDPSPRSREQLLELVGRVLGDGGDVGDQAAVALGVGGDAGQAGAVGVHAVVGARAVDDHVLLGPADGAPVAQRQLARRVHRVGAAACEEHGCALHRRQLGDPVGQLERRPVGGPVEGLVAGQRAHLLGRRVGDLGAAVADVGVPERGLGVDVLAALVVPDPGALAADDDDLVVLDQPPCPRTDARAGCSRG